MLFTILYALWFTVTLMLTVVMYLPYLILKLLKKPRTAARYVALVVPAWARWVVRMTGSRVTVTGLENLPRDRAVCFIGNHQGNFDIPLVLGALRRKIGFIAKIELMKVPILPLWMKALDCIFIDRKKLHHSLRNIQKGIQAVHAGNNMLLFPEGTRSRSARMGPFKPGGVQMAIKAGVPIVPLTVNGSFRVFEEKKRIRRGDLTLFVHPVIDPKLLDAAQKEALVQKIHDQISEKLPGRSG